MNPDGAKSGLVSLLAELRPHEAAVTAEPEQMDMLGIAPAAREAVLRGERRGPGRPPGSTNRRTEAWRDYLLARYRSPLETLAVIQSMPTAELARDMGCSLIEALQEQRQAAIALAPYLAQRMPIAVDLQSHKFVSLTIVTGEDQPEAAIESGIVDVVEYQQVSDGERNEL